jgi:hypothetical protein
MKETTRRFTPGINRVHKEIIFQIPIKQINLSFNQGKLQIKTPLILLSESTLHIIFQISSGPTFKLIPYKKN